MDLNAYGVMNMTCQEMVETDGGIVEFLYEYVTGRSLAQDARKLTKAVADAYAEVIQEGGTVCTDMPFK